MNGARSKTLGWPRPLPRWREGQFENKSPVWKNALPPVGETPTRKRISRWGKPTLPVQWGKPTLPLYLGTLLGTVLTLHAPGRTADGAPMGRSSSTRSNPDSQLAAMADADRNEGAGTPRSSWLSSSGDAFGISSGYMACQSNARPRPPTCRIATVRRTTMSLGLRVGTRNCST